MCNLINIPTKVKFILDTLHEAGYEAYAVGGCVRDSLLNREPEDWDITTSAQPPQVKALFRRTIDTGIQHGTVTIMQGKDAYEVTTYRIDGAYEDNRHPKDVTFTTNLYEDLKRRDFTINAMAYDEENGIVDAFTGMEDLRNHVIRAVGVPEERFSEDALRILRALRFSAQLNYEIEESTKEAIVKLKDTLSNISAERIRTELMKLLLSMHPEKLDEVYRLGITRVILPEYDNLTDAQRADAIDSLKRSVTQQSDEREDGFDKCVRLSLLFIPMGEKVARDVLRRLKFDNDTIDKVTKLTAHATDVIALNPPQVRRSIVTIGVELMPRLFAIKRALCVQSDSYIDAYEEQYQKVLSDGDCISMKELAVAGKDLIAECGMKSGKELGEMLARLFDAVLEDASLNSREQLIALCYKLQEQ